MVGGRGTENSFTEPTWSLTAQEEVAGGVEVEGPAKTQDVVPLAQGCRP